MRLVLDTSALLYIVEHRVEVEQFFGHEVYIPTAVVEELRRLRKKKAKVALELLPLLRPKVVERGGAADEAVLKCARELGAVLVTGDSTLAKRARELGVAVGRFHKKQLYI
ncbi:MAG: PIN domain-containing protein [Pyrobaculum sp.]